MKSVYIPWVGLMAWLLLATTAESREWTNISQTLPEFTIRALAIDPRNSEILYAGSDRRVYRSENGGVSWKKVLSLRGNDRRIRCIYVDPSDSKTVLVGADNGLHLSQDHGKHWSVLAPGTTGQSKQVFAILKDVSSSQWFWIGTGAGLYVLDTKNNQASPITAVSNTAVSAIAQSDPDGQALLVTTADGLYRRQRIAGTGDAQIGWQRIAPAPRREVSQENQSLEQFGIEEIFTAPYFAQVISHEDSYYVASANGLYRATQQQSDLELMNGQNFQSRRVSAVTHSSKTLYAATDRGIFQWDEASKRFNDLNQGLESTAINTVQYSPHGDYLVVGTDRGVYQMTHPDWVPEILPDSSKAVESVTAQEILRRFDLEPSIVQVQQAAIRYAEVYPEKIESWRRAASRKALFPTISLDTDLNNDQNIDIDRGGTNDPDRFIEGPNEKSVDWSVGVSWDLGDLIWNNDQTSIDTRSKLMVELRDDILSEVTHLYYERRRLEVELAMSPSRDLAIQIEKTIRLEELTALLDGLTGGYYSKALQETAELAKARG